jgi:hypothetical protein
MSSHAHRLFSKNGLLFKYGRETFYIIKGGYYHHGGEPVLKVMTPEGELYAILTVNVVNKDESLQPGEYCIKTWSENEKITKVLRESVLFKDTGKRIPTGYCVAEVWKLVAVWPKEKDNG